jgi:hypothetical protein
VIHVRFDPEALSAASKEEWNAWLKAAEAATRKTISLWEDENRRDFEPGIWSQLKNWLLDHVFHGKCAYCETHLGGARQPGDAEHFRPKGGVNYRQLDAGSAACIPALAEDETVTPATTIQHPGYFWLAYNWKNLLPACNFCNRAAGKRNQFPIRRKRYAYLKRLTEDQVRELQSPPYPSRKWGGAYYLAPEDLNDLESPLLLHPYFDTDINDHIGFDSRGQVYARKQGGERSPKGRQSIVVYDLANEDLRIRRQAAQEIAQTKFAAAVVYFRMCQGQSRQQAVEEAWKEQAMQDLLAGRKEYSAAALSTLREEYGSPPGVL